MRSVMVSLGGQQYEVTAPALGSARVWRKRVHELFGELAGGLVQVFAIDMPDSVAALGAVLPVVERMGGLLLGSADQLVDLLFEFSPTLRNDRERILEEASDEEALDAFKEVLSLAYPFGKVMELVSGALKSPTG